MKRRRLQFQTFDELLDEVDRLQAGGGRGYRRTGTWTLAQICDHLRLFQECSMRGFHHAPVAWWRRKLFPLLFPLLLWRGRIPRGVEAPAEFQPRPAAADDPAAIDAFRHSAREVACFPGPFYPNPLFGILTPDQWRRLHLIHSAHHLGFLIPAQTLMDKSRNAPQ